MPSFSSRIEKASGGLRCSAASDVGMRRTSNQDSMAVELAGSPEQWQSHGHLLLVADGMGAHAAGELASKMATDTIPHSYQKRTGQPPSEAIAEAVREANLVINNKGQNSVDFQGMGTTCSCLLLLPQGALVAHVGDSRVYRLRGSRFEQLSFDHSLVWEMAAAGQASEEDVPAYVPKNVITRSLGPHPTVAIDLEGPFEIKPGDRFLLCSDGLTGPLSPDLIGMVLASLPPTEATQSLIDLANLLGGPDNITSVVAEVSNPDKLGQPADPDSEEKFHFTSNNGNSSSQLLWWIATLLFGALGIGFALNQKNVEAALSGVGFFFFGFLALRSQLNASKYNCCAQPISLRGKAPYRCHDCQPSVSNIGALSDIVRQLEDLENQRDWEFDWQPILAEQQTAHAAVERADYRAAVVGYCRAVRRLMTALRNSAPPDSSDSNVDL